MDIFNNPIIKNAALGQLKKLCKEKNISLVAIFYNPEKDDFDIELKSGVNHIIPDEDFNKFKIAYLKTLNNEFGEIR